jgi:hypothetical protein
MNPKAARRERESEPEDRRDPVETVIAVQRQLELVGSPKRVTTPRALDRAELVRALNTFQDVEALWRSGSLPSSPSTRNRPHCAVANEHLSIPQAARNHALFRDPSSKRISRHA